LTEPLNTFHIKKEFTCSKKTLDDYLHTQAKQDVKHVCRFALYWYIDAAKLLAVIHFKAHKLAENYYLLKSSGDYFLIINTCPQLC